MKKSEIMCFIMVKFPSMLLDIQIETKNDTLMICVLRAGLDVHYTVKKRKGKNTPSK